MKKTRCDSLACFACTGANCKVLQEAITDRPCPFCKTDKELEDGRKESLERLQRIGRDDLIEKYTANIRAYKI